MSWGTLGAIVAGLLVGLVVVWAVLLVLLWLIRPRDARVADALRVIPDLVRLCRALAVDRSLPLGVRLPLFGLAAWLVSPIDLVPEFLPVIGPLDDVIVAALVLRHVRRRLGEAELRRRWPGTAEGFSLLERLIGGPGRP